MSIAPAVIPPLPLKVSTPPMSAGCGLVSPIPVPLSKPLSTKAYCPFKSDSLPPVVQVGAALTVMLRLAVAVLGVGKAESLTCTVKVDVPAAVGVPEIWPDEFRLIPGGSEPAVTSQVYGATPPLAFRLVLGYAVLTVPVGSELDVVETVRVATVTVMLRLAVAVCAVGVVESVACTVKLKGLPVLVFGVPEITPVLGTKVSPGGSEPALILQVMGVAPPLDCSVAL